MNRIHASFRVIAAAAMLASGTLTVAGLSFGQTTVLASNPAVSGAGST